MGLFLILLVLIFILARNGRLGPFVWDGPRWGDSPGNRWGDWPRQRSGDWPRQRSSDSSGQHSDDSCGEGSGDSPAQSSHDSSGHRCGGPRWVGGPRAGRAGDPERILAERLANGELTPEEYLERMSVLRQQ